MYKTMAGGFGGSMPVAAFPVPDLGQIPPPLEASSNSMSSEPKLRQKFPETWIWTTQTSR